MYKQARFQQTVIKMKPTAVQPAFLSDQMHYLFIGVCKNLVLTTLSIKYEVSKLCQGF